MDKLTCSIIMIDSDLHMRLQYQYPIYIEDISSTQISPGLNGIEHPQWDRRLHHGHAAFCTWATIEI